MMGMSMGTMTNGSKCSECDADISGKFGVTFGDKNMCGACCNKVINKFEAAHGEHAELVQPQGARVKMKQCPKCGTKSPPTKWSFGDFSSYEYCQVVVGWWFFGLFPVRCGYIGAWEYFGKEYNAWLGKEDTVNGKGKDHNQ